MDYEIVLKLMSIKFNSRQTPRETKQKFEFQLGYHSWRYYDKSKGKLEYHLWKHAEYILKYASLMISDP